MECGHASAEAVPMMGKAYVSAVDSTCSGFTLVELLGCDYDHWRACGS